MGRRILNRKEMRADYDEAERRQQTEEGEAEDEQEEDEDEDEEAEGEGEAEAEAEGDEEGDEEEAPAPKKKAPAKPKPKAKPKSRARTAKVVRMRQVWGVFNNSNQMVTTYEYPKKQDALAHAAKLTADKKSTHFVQPVKEPIEEKKE